MNRNKIFPILLIIAMLAAFPTSTVLAATGTSTLGSGTILNISLNTDPVTKITSEVVTLLDDAGASQKITISLESAITLKLLIPNAAMIGQPVVIPDPLDPSKVFLSGTLGSLVFFTTPTTQITSLSLIVIDAAGLDQTASLDLEPAVALKLISPDPTMIGTPIVIDPTLIIKSITLVKGTTALETFFGTALGLSGEELAAYKAEGYGYGEIAQACWMATQLGGDAALLDQILTAKQTGDFSTFVLPEGAVVTNWGQLRKAILTDPHQNLGQIMSGHADPLVITAPTAPTTPSTMVQGNGKSHGSGHGHENMKGGHK